MTIRNSLIMLTTIVVSIEVEATARPQQIPCIGALKVYLHVSDTTIELAALTRPTFVVNSTGR